MCRMTRTYYICGDPLCDITLEKCDIRANECVDFHLGRPDCYQPQWNSREVKRDGIFCAVCQAIRDTEEHLERREFERRWARRMQQRQDQNFGRGDVAAVLIMTQSSGYGGSSQLVSGEINGREIGAGGVSGRGFATRPYSGRGFGGRDFDDSGFDSRGYGGSDFGGRECGDRDLAGRRYGDRDFGSDGYGGRQYVGRDSASDGYGGRNAGSSDFVGRENGGREYEREQEFEQQGRETPYPTTPGPRRVRFADQQNDMPRSDM